MNRPHAMGAGGGGEEEAEEEENYWEIRRAYNSKWSGGTGRGAESRMDSLLEATRGLGNHEEQIARLLPFLRKKERKEQITR